MTPFLLDLACAFSPAPMWKAGPWAFDAEACELTLYGEIVEPLGWQDMETLAPPETDARRWLKSLRDDAEHRLAIRAESGSIFEPRR